MHVRAFFDSNADGIGDFQGLTQKLDYLQELGATTIWLLPFYPSPLKDDGYDIADYYSINPVFGTLEDFHSFLEEAHRRQLRVITELVVNHTSDQHPWFQRSRRAAPGSPWRNFYVWSDNPDRYKEARIIFRDFEQSNWTWDPVAQAYFWHRFYSHQPDLNYDNPEVHRELMRVLDFWFDMGVDGLRLDAVPYLYEREGTSCENLPETHQYLKILRRHVDEKYGDRMLLGEANQWPEDAVSYFGTGLGDECHMAFHFPLMPRLFMAVRMEDRVPIVDILEQTPPIPETSQWALFLRNHDELTLEMVTDEERDYMYRVYANDAKARINLGIRRRLAPLLSNDRRRIELLHLLLFSFPGTPFLYYGDEIGMGDNIYLGDRNGVRTPMQWSSDKNAGFSRASPHALYAPIILDPEYHYEAVNVEAQQRNLHSLFWWVKRVLTLRKRHKAFSRGTLQFLKPDNRKILAFVRQYEEETILVVANLSRFPQPAKVDLSAFEQMVPVELFGRTEFPVIGKSPYSLTLGAHVAFWFTLEPVVRRSRMLEHNGKVTLRVQEHWQELLQANRSAELDQCLRRYIRNRRWFGGKTREIKSVIVRDVPKLPGANQWAMSLLEVDYVQGDAETYALPLAVAAGEEALRIEAKYPQLAIANVHVERTGVTGLLYDATGSKGFCRALLDCMANNSTAKDGEGVLKASTGPAFARVIAGENNGLEPALAKAEQSNSSVVYGDKLFLKLFRRIEPGPNPDLEVGRFLTERNFANTAGVAGAVEYSRKSGESLTLGILTEFFAGAKDAWDFTLDTLSRYFERVRALPPEARPELMTEGHLLDHAAQEPPEAVVGILGTYVEAARVLGTRTGEMHLVLGSDPDIPEFAPEPFTPFYQRSLFQSMRNLAVESLDLLRRGLPDSPQDARADAEKVLELQPELLSRFRAVYQTRIHARRIRCHGDFHLGQVLYTGKDFIIIDFEGEPARPMGERRIKRSPLRDVAGMIRSFDYAAHAALLVQVERGTLRQEQLPELESSTAFWHHWVSAVYLRGYLDVVRSAELLPTGRQELAVLLDALLLEKAVYEVTYEANNRPGWLKIPLQGILRLLSQGTKPATDTISITE
jgi:maltose alpha-D-glucosyltransferase/alpha-amylase